MGDKEINIAEKIIKETENKLNEITASGINQSNIDYISTLVDVHKDLKNEEYWKEKIMRYGNYRYDDYDDSRYGRGRKRDSRGRYMGKHRGHEILDEMGRYYGEYVDGVEMYGHDNETDKSFDRMIDCFEEFAYAIVEEIDEPMKADKIRKVARKISEM